MKSQIGPLTLEKAKQRQQYMSLSHFPFINYNDKTSTEDQKEETFAQLLNKDLLKVFVS